MAIRTIRETGDPILEKRCKEVKEMTPRLQELIADMLETMRNANGVGLAAPQVGILKRLVLIEVEEGQPQVLLNPRIVEQEGEQTDYEGCLSVPGMTGVVTRPYRVVCEALNEHMEPIVLEGEGLMARCICHELDHLDGRLYPELALEMMTNEELAEREKQED